MYEVTVNKYPEFLIQSFTAEAFKHTSKIYSSNIETSYFSLCLLRSRSVNPHEDVHTHSGNNIVIFTQSTHPTVVIDNIVSNTTNLSPVLHAEIQS